VRGAASLAAALTLLAPAVAGASREPAALAIAAWPARVVLTAPGRATIRVENPGGDAVVIDAAPSGYRLDLRGRPQLQAAGALAAWVRVRPARVALPGRSVAELSVTATRAAAARPGDHALVVLLTTRLPTGRALLAHLRIGVVVVLRVPGTVVRRLAVGGLRVERHRRQVLFEVSVANRGNVDEWLARRRLELRLVGRGGVLARLHGEPRRLLARTRGLVEARYTGRIRGPLTVVVALTGPRPGVNVLRRTFRIRL
jgi:hypothetical protein